jgi:hypothetical protein
MASLLGRSAMALHALAGALESGWSEAKAKQMTARVDRLADLVADIGSDPPIADNAYFAQRTILLDAARAAERWRRREGQAE